MRGFVPVKTTKRKNKEEIEGILKGVKTFDYPDLILPTRSDMGSAGYDLYSPINVTIFPQESVVIWTDFKAYMLADEYLSIHIRSSLGIKHRLSLMNTTGIIDSSYANNPDNDGNIAICIKNNGDEPYIIKRGDRVAQGIFQKYLVAINDNILNETRQGGIGSSGK